MFAHSYWSDCTRFINARTIFAKHVWAERLGESVKRKLTMEREELASLILESLFVEELALLEEIPEEFRRVALLSNGKMQMVDIRLCYNWDGEKYVECSSVAAHAEQEGFSPGS